MAFFKLLWLNISLRLPRALTRKPGGLAAGPPPSLLPLLSPFAFPAFPARPVSFAARASSKASRDGHSIPSSFSFLPFLLGFGCQEEETWPLLRSQQSKMASSPPPPAPPLTPPPPVRAFTIFSRSGKKGEEGDMAPEEETREPTGKALLRGGQDFAQAWRQRAASLECPSVGIGIKTTISQLLSFRSLPTGDLLGSRRQLQGCRGARKRHWRKGKQKLAGIWATRLHLIQPSLFPWQTSAPSPWQ